MIKRRFYKMEHGDRDDPSNQSSSSSDSEIEVEPEATEDSEYDDDDVIEDHKEDAEPCSTSSGYKSEDSSANEIHVDLSGFPIDEDNAKNGNERQSPLNDLMFGKSGSEFQEKSSNTNADKESLSVDLPEYVVKRKSIFKCRICTRIVCLNEEALRAHLKSKSLQSFPLGSLRQGLVSSRRMVHNMALALLRVLQHVQWWRLKSLFFGRMQRRF